MATRAGTVAAVHGLPAARAGQGTQLIAPDRGPGGSHVEPRGQRRLGGVAGVHGSGDQVPVGLPGLRLRVTKGGRGGQARRNLAFPSGQFSISPGCARARYKGWRAMLTRSLLASLALRAKPSLLPWAGRPASWDREEAPTSCSTTPRTDSTHELATLAAANAGWRSRLHSTSPGCVAGPTGPACHRGWCRCAECRQAPAGSVRPGRACAVAALCG